MDETRFRYSYIVPMDVYKITNALIVIVMVQYTCLVLIKVSKAVKAKSIWIPLMYCTHLPSFLVTYIAIIIE